MRAVLVCALSAALLTAANPYADKPDAIPAGAKLYARHCAACHGETAEGRGRAPSLRIAMVHDAAPEQLFQTLTNGVMRRGMPSWAHLPSQRRWQIITYIKSLPPAP